MLQAAKPAGYRGDLAVFIEIGCVRQNSVFQLAPNLACHFLLDCCAYEECVRRVACM